MNPTAHARENDLTHSNNAHAIESLLTEIVFEEAQDEVWMEFNQVLQKLPAEGLEIFEKHLDGFTAAQIGKEKQLSEAEVKKLIQQLKRDLLRHLRGAFEVRH